MQQTLVRVCILPLRARSLKSQTSAQPIIHRSIPLVHCLMLMAVRCRYKEDQRATQSTPILTVPELLSRYPALSSSFAADAGTLNITTFGAAGTESGMAIDEAVGRSVVQDALPGPVVPPLTAVELVEMNNPHKWPCIRIGEIFKLKYASRRRLDAPSSLSSKWQPAERRADRQHVAICGQFGIPYVLVLDDLCLICPLTSRGIGMAARGQVTLRKRSLRSRRTVGALGLPHSAACAVVNPFRKKGVLFRTFLRITKLRLPAVLRNENCRYGKAAGTGGNSTCWCKVPNDLLVTAPNRSLEAGSVCSCSPNAS